MAKTITLNLEKDLIMEAVKAETYDTGRIIKSNDPVKNAPTSLSEQAGGEQHQERQLLRALKEAVGRFESQMVEFLDAGNGTIDNTLSSAVSHFTITMVVSDRYNEGLRNPMSSICEAYIINMVLYIWWNARDQAFAKQYYANTQDSIDHIRLCLAKTAPDASAVDYFAVNGEVTGANIVSIAFPNATYQATLGQAFSSPSPTTAPAGLALTYSSSNQAVATVNASTGVVTPVGAGSCVITAHFGGNSAYRPGSGAYTLNVSAS